MTIDDNTHPAKQTSSSGGNCGCGSNISVSIMQFENDDRQTIGTGPGMHILLKEH
jgi:hypothetical protein